MRNMTITLLMTLLVTSAAHSNDTRLCNTQQVPVAEGVKPHLISKDFLFLEGPTWSDARQQFLFSEMDFSKPQTHGPKAKIYALTLPDEISVFIEDSGTNGLHATKQGLYAMTHNTQSLSAFSWKTKENTVIASHYQGKSFNSPNDLALHSAGHVFFSDPDWQLGVRESQLGFTGVFKFDAKTNQVILIDSTLNKPNGVVLSLDEHLLFVGDADGNINQYHLNKDGDVLKKGEIFARVEVPDGMAIDCAGNLYITSHSKGAVLIFNPRGELLQTIDVAPSTTNVAFGGEDNKTLLITTGNGLFTLPVNIPGAGSYGLIRMFPRAVTGKSYNAFEYLGPDASLLP